MQNNGHQHRYGRHELVFSNNLPDVLRYNQLDNYKSVFGS